MKNTLIIILGAVLLLFGSCKDQPTDTDCVDRSKIDKNKACYSVYDPVCGCDNITYGNDCEAKKNGVTRYTKGACRKNDNNSTCIDRSKIDNNKPCYKIYAPVCGCDNVTYGNDCEATKKGVTRFTKGECKKQDNNSNCIDKNLINKNSFCPGVYNPVCGCDSVTYGNDCEAKKNGVTRYTKGECKKQDNRIEGNCNDIDPKNEACQAYFQRWFYNKNRNQCEMIGYSGCSQKGFATQQDCEKCMNAQK